MIQGPIKTEAQYRAVGMDSSSSLKEFSLDRKKYYRKYVLGEKSEDSDTKASITGRVVETLLLEPELFDQRFHMSIVSKAPTSMMLEFVEALYRHTAAATNEDGVVTRSFEDICVDAHKDSGFKIKLDAVLGKFIGSDAEVYYQEIREVRSKGLTVVTTDEITNAEKIVNELKTNPVTSEVINLVNSSRYTIYNQHQIEGYTIDGHKLKSMFDKIVIDHQKKTIVVYDLKCVWAVEGFYDEYYLYRRAYIQAYLYYRAAEFIRNTTPEYAGYSVLYPQFIACDSTNYLNPLIYTLSDIDIDDAYNGFEHKGRKYPGVKEIIENIEWAVENDKWNISRKNYLNNGIVNIRD